MSGMRVNKENVPWLEKYRPKKLDDVVGNSEAIDRFKYFEEHGNLPNFILSGPPGVGKTTVSVGVWVSIMLANLDSQDDSVPGSFRPG